MNEENKEESMNLSWLKDHLITIIIFLITIIITISAQCLNFNNIVDELGNKIEIDSWDKFIKYFFRLPNLWDWISSITMSILNLSVYATFIANAMEKANTLSVKIQADEMLDKIKKKDFKYISPKRFAFRQDLVKAITIVASTMSIFLSLRYLIIEFNVAGLIGAVMTIGLTFMFGYDGFRKRLDYYRYDYLKYAKQEVAKMEENKANARD